MRSNHQLFRKTPGRLNVNPPSISITTQPQNSTATPAYQVVTAGPPVIPIMTISPATPNGTTSINLNNITTFQDFVPGVEYTLTPNVSFTARVYLVGAMGGFGQRGGRDQQVGGLGGYVQGTLTLNAGQSYKVRVGGAGASSRSFNNLAATFTGAGLKAETTGGSYPGAQGGGYTGLFLSSATQANALLIASGGGGASEDPASGGNGGLPNGSDGSNGSRAGKGATQTSGGLGAGGGQAGSALTGGNGAGAGAGGGGGYFGGGGGSVEGAGTGGGGSSYFNPTLVTVGSYSRVDSAGGGESNNRNGSFKLSVISVAPGQNTDPIVTDYPETPGTFTIASSFTSGATGSLSYQWYRVGSGAIPGATGTTLTVPNVEELNGSQYYCQVNFNRSGNTANALNSPLLSNTVTLTVRPVIIITQQPTSQFSSTTSSAIFAVAATVSNGTNNQLSYRWKLNGIQLNDGTNTITGGSFTASGVTTPTLTISGTTIGQYEIAVDVSHPVAVNSTLQSNEINYTVTAPRNSINYEFVSETSATALALTGQVDLNTNPLTLNFDSSRNLQIIYSTDQDLRVRAEIFGGRGNNNGGQGGYSLIEFVMQRNTEYVVTRDDAGKAIFIYRKSSLMAAVGSGADGNTTYLGGGVGLLGVLEPVRLSKYSGSQIITTSSDPAGVVNGGLNNSYATEVQGDFIGVAYQCPIGSFYRNITPCSDIPGNTQFRVANGTVITNTASIQRGYKASNPIEHLRNTSRYGSGYGVLGGTYKDSRSSTGGGSGYTDRSFTTINSTRGGSNETYGKVIITLASAAVTPVQIWGTVPEHDTLNLTAPAGKVFTKVIFASYGTPTGEYPNYTISSCHSSTSTERVAAAFIGKSSGSIAAENSVFGDPCVGTFKRLYVILECA